MVGLGRCARSALEVTSAHNSRTSSRNYLCQRIDACTPNYQTEGSSSQFLNSERMSHSRSLDVGVLIALREEFREFHTFLERDLQPLADVSRGETWYRFRGPSSYEGVATFIGDMGPTDAALVADRLITSWDPSTIVMLGIAAGIHDDLKVGDVVVASQVDSYLDASKANPHPGKPAAFEFALGGNVYRANWDLVLPIRHLEFSHASAYALWQEASISDFEKLIPDGDQRERLLKSDLLRLRPTLADAHLASGPVVGAAAAFSQWLHERRDRNHKALDMESSGLASAAYRQLDPTRVLVLRGLSDYGDERKKDLEEVKEAALRRYAMRNATRLLWVLMETGLLPKDTRTTTRPHSEAQPRGSRSTNASAGRLQNGRTNAAQNKPTDQAVTKRSKSITESSPVRRDALALSQLFADQSRLLERFANEVLACFERQHDPTRPLLASQMMTLLAGGSSIVLDDISSRQFETLISDAQNHGALPGLIRTNAGYSLPIAHIAYRRKRALAAKTAIARAAASLVRPQMRIAIDGGTTTLAIAEQLIERIDAGALSTLTVVTNSIAVIQSFADFAELQGWTDHTSPIRLLVPAGLVRGITKTIAEVDAAVTDCRDSLQALVKLIGGLDYSFIGVNGIDHEVGLTMPSKIELPTKKFLLASARFPIVVGDVDKFGLRYPTNIASWSDQFTVLTNRVSPEPPAVAAVLKHRGSERITFADPVRQE
jgi:DeoR/GlpR family transcriptional regulator of sugar metabolism/nucleoside phosphorylase